MTKRPGPSWNPENLTLADFDDVPPERRLFLCSGCKHLLPKSDEGPTGSDGSLWCQDCASEGEGL